MRSGVRIVGVIGLFIVLGIAAVALRPHRAERRPALSTALPAADNSRPEVGNVANRDRALRPRSSAPSLHPEEGDGTPDVAESPAKPGGFSSPPVSLVGVLTAPGRATLSVPQPARIVEVLVHEGQSVRPGQTLVLLDDAQARAQSESARAGLTAARAQADRARAGEQAQREKADSDVVTAQAGLRQAQGKLQQALLARDAAASAEKSDRVAAQENVRKAQAALDHARKQLNSLEELARVGGVSRNDLEGARTQVATAEADLSAAKAQARSLEAGPGKGVSYRAALAQQDVDAAQEGVKQARAGLEAARRGRRQVQTIAEDDVRAADAALAQAAAGLEGARTQAAMARLTSPIDCIATGVGAHTGETAQPGTPLVTILSPADLRIEALAPARQVPRLHPGQTARVLLDTRPARPLTARLEAISQVAEPDGRSFRVRFRLLNPPLNLRLDQSVRILIP
jgi:multidrug resistance efflux pump